jgi:hypothetical protein
LAFTLADRRDPSHISPDSEGRLFWTVDASMLRNILPRLWLVNGPGSIEPGRLISAARE